MTATQATGRQRAPGPRQEQEILTRLRKATGQLAGITGMYEDGRYCIDILDQLSAVAKAVDAVALLVLTDHVKTCVREAVTTGDPTEKIDELGEAIRRYMRGR